MDKQKDTHKSVIDYSGMVDKKVGSVNQFICFQNMPSSPELELGQPHLKHQ